jgi:CubicO group peptidase (beta-lactamase class C family)
MVPAAFVAVERIPLTANGKLDRRALPAVERTALRHDREYVSPRTETERVLAGVWSQVLGVPTVGARDTFFGLGGDSLLTLQVIATARQAGLSIPVRMLYQYESLEELAAAIDARSDSARATGGATPAPPEQPLPRGPLPRQAVPRQAVPREAVRRPAPWEARVREAMAEHHVPGVSLAVIRDGEFVSARGYGILATGEPDPVTPDTVFRVASISKHVTALGALQLAAQGRLDLDEDVNSYLRLWRLPVSEHGGAVTVRHLLANVAGLTRYARVSYRPGEQLPALLDVLHGRPPARTRAVRREVPPGTAVRLGVNNYFVLQQVMHDLVGVPFAEMMRGLVFTPLGLTGTSYDPEFPRACGGPVARGHDQDGGPVADELLIPPEYAAAGLWSTASDLARIAMEIRRARLGQPAMLLTPSLAKQMLQPHPGSSYGLSTLVDDTGRELEFGHAGEITGYRAVTMMRINSGGGVVVLTNGESGKQVIKAVESAVGGESNYVSAAGADQDPVPAIHRPGHRRS